MSWDSDINLIPNPSFYWTYSAILLENPWKATPLTTLKDLLIQILSLSWSLMIDYIALENKLGIEITFLLKSVKFISFLF